MSKMAQELSMLAFSVAIFVRAGLSYSFDGKGKPHM